MARKKETERKKRKGKRNLVFGVLIALILYIGTHLLSRTDGARNLVADKISNGTRLPVAIESCKATPLLGLHLKGLDFYGVKMPDVRVRFDWLSWLSEDKPFVKQLDIQGLEVRLKRVPATGNWEPLVLHGLAGKLGSVLGLNPPSVDPDPSLPQFPRWVINKNTVLQLERAKAVWQDEQGKDLAYVADADLAVESKSFIDRKVRQTLFKSGHIKLASGKLLRDFQLEAFLFEGAGCATILDMADSDGEYPPFSTQDLWQDLGLRLSSLSEL